MNSKHYLLFLTMMCFCMPVNAQSWDWATGAGGTSYDIANDIYTDINGNSYLTGWFQNTVNFGPDTLVSVGGYDIFVAKYNSSGVCQWATGIGSSANDAGYGVICDSQGNVYVTGAVQGTALFGTTPVTSNGDEDIFVAAFNPAGVCQWATSGGSTLDDQGQAIAIDQSGNIIVSGYIKGTAFFNAFSLVVSGSSDVFTGKVNSSGVWQWVEKGGGISGDNGYGVTTDAGNNIYITGYFRGAATFGTQLITATGMDDVYIVKYDSSGNCQWAQKGGGTDDEHGNGIVADAAGNTYLTGWFTGGGMSFGGFALTASGTNEELFVAKYDVSGSPQWAVSAGSSGFELGTGICLDASGNPVISASYQSAFTIGITPIASYGGQDVLVAKFSKTNGANLWALAAGGSSSDVAFKIGADGSGNIYTAGNFNGTGTFGTYSLVSQGIADVFIAKVKPGISGIEVATEPQTGAVYPNPAAACITVSLNESGFLLLFNSTGNPCGSWQLQAGENEIRTGDLPAGVYFYRIMHGERKLKTGKLLLR